MTDTLLFVGVGSIFIVGVATLVTAILTLRSARRYVELAEKRMECLREGQARLFLLLHKERERAAQTYHDGQPVRSEKQQGYSSPFEEPGESTLEHHEFPKDETLPQKGTSPGTGEPPVSSSKAVASGRQRESQEVSAENRRTPLAVWHPHPDDDVTPRSASAGQDSRKNAAPMKMFRTLYDRYLDNYEGYVKLAERLCRSRDNDEILSGSPEEREWEERLRRAYDGIERTIARLDILEGSNPELATDDRVSQRASIAQSHSRLPQRPRREAIDEERTDIFTGT